jgi:hypothetical protein
LHGLLPKAQLGAYDRLMPWVTLRTETAAHKEEQVSEYICDVADCPYPAEHVLGFIRGLRAFAAVCARHKRMLVEKNRRPDTSGG